MILKEDPSDPGDPSDPRRRRALLKKRMRAMRGGLHLLPRKRCEQCKEENSIVHRGGESNARWHSSILRCGGGERNAQRHSSSAIQGCCWEIASILYSAVLRRLAVKKKLFFARASQPFSLLVTQGFGNVVVDSDRGRRIYQRSQGLLDRLVNLFGLRFLLCLLP